MEILEIGKRIVQAIQESDNVAANQLILEFQGKALELQSANYELKQKIDELEAEINQIGQMQFDGKVYWRTLEDGDDEGPFCPRCVDVDSRAVRLHFHESRVQGYSSRWYECLGCQSHINL